MAAAGLTRLGDRLPVDTQSGLGGVRPGPLPEVSRERAAVVRERPLDPLETAHR